MASLYSHGNAVAAIAVGIVVTFVSVMGQTDKTNCPGQCPKPHVGKSVSFVIKKQISNVTNLSDCFPYHTELLYVCKEPETNQFGPTLNQYKIFRKCTGKGWLDGTDQVDDYSPTCAKRENHCHSLPASNPNIIFEIHGQNISIDHNNSASLNYTVGTIATYKCKNPKQNYSQLWTCTKNSDSYYSWKKNNDIVCEESPSKGDLTEKPNNLFTTETAEIRDFDSETQTSDRARSLPSANLPRDLLIGICSFLGFVLIAVLFGILYKNRIGKRYKDVSNHARQPPFTSVPEGENKLEPKFVGGEENFQYANIIPIKVNQETIYAEVEIGKIGKSIPTVKLTIDDDQLHTTYAEIRHSVIPKDQHR